MPDEALRTLHRQLGEEVPEGVRALDEDRLQDLSDAIADARHRQAEAIADAGERALGQIPRLLRGPIRRIVG